MYIRKSNEYTDQRPPLFIIDALATFLGHSDLSRSTRCRIGLYVIVLYLPIRLLLVASVQV